MGTPETFSTPEIGYTDVKYGFKLNKKRNGNKESQKLYCRKRYILLSAKIGRPGCIFADTPI
jgi:hypothetical protein